MARLHKIPPFTGTQDGICIYHMRGSFFVRTASSLTAERVKKDPAFVETRRHSEILSKASQLSSAVYKKITGKNKTREMYRLLTGQAIRMLKNKMDEPDIIRTLSEWYV